jgi:Ca-activated chloride channel homolog
MRRSRTLVRLLTAVLIALLAASMPVAAQEGFSFRSGVDLVNVTATVTGPNGRFVRDLRRDDFLVYDDGVLQEITHFSSERVPVSLGILLDSSGSMSAEKMAAARSAITRFVGDLLGGGDEFFLMEFSDNVTLVQDWTSERSDITRALGRIRAAGGTALYDAIAEALPIAASGAHQKKALLVISDGNDTDSAIRVNELRQAIRESEVLVYALGVDSNPPPPRVIAQPRRRPPDPQPPIPFPIPRPGPRGPLGLPQPSLPQIFGGARPPAASSERVNAGALRQITDDTGGRTEIIRRIDDLPDATSRIADELSQQYSLAYQSPHPRDGRWHSIEVKIRRGTYTVRARSGYTS